MSLHRLTEDTAHHDMPLAAESGEGRSYEGRVVCSCGHVGEWRGGSTLAMHELLRIDYREHVEDALGPDATWLRLPVRTAASSRSSRSSSGRTSTPTRAPDAGQRMLTPDNDAWHESREESRRWSR